MRCPYHALVKQSKDVRVEGVGVIPVEFCPRCDHWNLISSKFDCFCDKQPGRHHHKATEQYEAGLMVYIVKHNEAIPLTAR
jgi:hypothetical protein